MDYIEWRPENPDAVWTLLRWKPFGRDPEKRGATTVAVLGLLRDIPENVSAHVRAHVQLKMENLRDATARDDRADADRVWTGSSRRCSRRSCRTAATYDAIEWFLEHPSLAGARALVGRTLPRPGAVGVDPIRATSKIHHPCVRCRRFCVFELAPTRGRTRTRASSRCVLTPRGTSRSLVEILGLSRAYVEGRLSGPRGRGAPARRSKRMSAFITRCSWRSRSAVAALVIPTSPTRSRSRAPSPGTRWHQARWPAIIPPCGCRSIGHGALPPGPTFAKPPRGGGDAGEDDRRGGGGRGAVRGVRRQP